MKFLKIPFTLLALKHPKFLRINLTKDVQDLYTKKHKTPLREMNKQTKGMK